MRLRERGGDAVCEAGRVHNGCYVAWRWRRSEKGGALMLRQCFGPPLRWLRARFTSLHFAFCAAKSHPALGVTAR
jgi:hypothetical protein